MTEVRTRKWIITITVIMASLIELIDTSIVNVALPQMMGNLGATLDEVAWVVTAYVVANVIVIPMTGWLSAVFRTPELLRGVDHSVHDRVVLLRPCHEHLGARRVPRSSRERAAARFSRPPSRSSSRRSRRRSSASPTACSALGVVVGPTIGPTLGGWITDNYSWPWIFYVNIPIGIVAALLTFSYIREAKERRDVGRVDWAGIGLLIVGIGALQVVLERGESEDWFSKNYIVVLTFVAVAGITAFIWREMTAEHPVVDLRVFRDRSLAVGTIFTFILGFGLYSSVFIFPVFAQNLLGFTAMQTGLILLPGGIATAIMMPIVGKILQKRLIPAQLMNALGFVSFFLFTYLLSKSTLDSGRVNFFWPLIFRGVGLGFLFVPLTTLALSGLRGKDIPQGAGMTNMMRQLGGSFGIALVATYIQKRSWSHRQSLLTHVSIYDAPLRERLNAIVASLVAKGSPVVQARQQAYGAIDGIVQKQTFLLTYMDAFRITGIFFLCCIPLLLFFRKTKGAAVPVSMH